MDSILFLFLFIFPGAFSKLLQEKFFPQQRYRSSDHTGWVEISEMIVFSMVVLLSGLFARTFLLAHDFDVTEYVDSFSNTSFLITYISFSFLASIIYTFLFHLLNKYVIMVVINKLNQWKGRPAEGLYQTVWEELFETDGYIRKNNIVVSVEKDGHILSRGLLESYSPPQSPNNEILLKHCCEIEAYFEDDKTLPKESKIFGKTKAEYCNLQNGYVLKFYDMEKYHAYLDGIEDSAD